MAEESLDTLRLAFMQEFLPVGIAMVDRVRRGGASKVVEVFTASSNPLEELREEGEPAARSLRERLDQVSPGLGNPVMQVKVAVDDESPNLMQLQDKEVLGEALNRIEVRLDALEVCLNQSLSEVSSTKEI